MQDNYNHLQNDTNGNSDSLHRPKSKQSPRIRVHIGARSKVSRMIKLHLNWTKAKAKFSLIVELSQLQAGESKSGMFLLYLWGLQFGVTAHAPDPFPLFYESLVVPIFLWYKSV